MSEKAYIAISDLANIRRAQSALREITQKNSEDYIVPKDHWVVMEILEKWAKEIHKRIDVIDD